MKRVLSVFLCVCLLSTFICTSAFAKADYTGLIEEVLTTEVKTAITKNLTLPDSWNGTHITWESSNPNVISNDGVVTRMADDTTVTLAAKENGETVKELTFTVISRGTAVWFSENFYRPNETAELRASDAAASHSLDFIEKSEETQGRAGFYNGLKTSQNDSSFLGIVKNPINENDYALLSQNDSAETLKSSVFFSLPDGALPAGKVSISWTITTAELDKFSGKPLHRYIDIKDGGGTNIAELHWMSAGEYKLRIDTGSTNNASSIYAIARNGNEITSNFTLTFDFDNGTAEVTEVTNGTIHANNTYSLKGTLTGNLKSINLYPRELSSPDFYVDDVVITSTRQDIIIPRRSTEISAQYNSSADRFDVTVPYNEEYDLVHYFRDIKEDENTEYSNANSAMDLVEVRLKKKSTGVLTPMVGGGDEDAACFVNDSYIGGSHGQSSGVVVQAAAHGKTPADVGSRWTDAQGRVWNLIRVNDENTLMFISDNQGTSYADYSFLVLPKGTALTLSHAGNAQDKSDAVHTEAINGTVLRIDQIYRSYKAPERKFYFTVDGVREDVTDRVYAYEKFTGDVLEVEETYTIINPASIVETLRANRDYNLTKNPVLADGKEMLRVKNTYRYDTTGTLLVYMEYTALQDIELLSIGGIQYAKISAANGFGGGFHKYIPKVKAVTNITSTTGGQPIENFDLTQPWDCATANKPFGFDYDSSKWEDEDNPPNREIIYYKDTEGNIVSSFIAGYLPIGSAAPSVRKELVKNTAYYFYNSTKGYPQLVGKYKATEGEVFEAVGYRKYTAIDKADHAYTSVIPVTKDNDIYYFIDYHKTGKDTIILPDVYTYRLVEKSSNASYTTRDNIIETDVDCSGDKKYGYIVLKANKKFDIRISDGAYYSDTGYLACSMNNDTDDVSIFDAVAAIYDGEGKLIETVVLPDTTVEAGMEETAIFPFNNKDAAKVKIFALKSVETLSPITGALYANIK